MLPAIWNDSKRIPLFTFLSIVNFNQYNLSIVNFYQYNLSIVNFNQYNLSIVNFNQYNLSIVNFNQYNPFFESNLEWLYMYTNIYMDKNVIKFKFQQPLCHWVETKWIHWPTDPHVQGYQ